MQSVAPIEKLIPAASTNPNPMLQRMEIDKEISRHALLVHHLLHEAGVNTGVIYTTTEPPFPLSGQPPKQEEHPYDLVRNYFELPDEHGRRRTFELVMRSLEEGIGVYEARKERAFWELFNPLVWIAMIIRSPIWILERAGLMGDEKMHGLVVSAYERLVRYSLAVLVILAALKLGVSIPWRTILVDAIKAILR